ncbi:MAG: nucleotidyltransferase family protein [Chloroflexaceae bacterium]|nr:nucleotidyltransferase family protein [Chloroflexaceae bacterium]
MSLIAGNLGIMQRLLDEHTITWGIYGNAASHLYGNRLPIRTIDILVPPATLRTVVQVMQSAKRVGQFDGRRIMWSGINLYDDLSVRGDGAFYPFKMDTMMIGRLQRRQLLGSRVSFLSPEDVLIQMMLLPPPAAQKSHTYEEMAAIAQRHLLDLTYVRQRLSLCQALTLLSWYETASSDEQKIPPPAFFQP